MLAYCQLETHLSKIGIKIQQSLLKKIDWKMSSVMKWNDDYFALASVKSLSQCQSRAFPVSEHGHYRCTVLLTAASTNSDSTPVDMLLILTSCFFFFFFKIYFRDNDFEYGRQMPFFKMTNQISRNVIAPKTRNKPRFYLDQNDSMSFVCVCLLPI